MPSFLSKVFSRKKQDESKSPVLLEGKYEAVTAPSSSSGSPSPVDEHHDGFPGLSVFRTKSKPLQARTTTSTNIKEPPPALTLNLSDPEKQPVKDLGAVFDEGTDGEVSLDDATIGGRRLTPLETLLLVRACSTIIAERGEYCTLVQRTGCVWAVGVGNSSPGIDIMNVYADSRLFRFGDTWRHAPSLAFCLCDSPTQAH